MKHYAIFLANKQESWVGGVLFIVLRWFYGGPLRWFYGGSTVVLRWFYSGPLRWFYDGSTVVLRCGLFSEC